MLYDCGANMFDECKKNLMIINIFFLFGGFISYSIEKKIILKVNAVTRGF